MTSFGIWGTIFFVFLVIASSYAAVIGFRRSRNTAEFASASGGYKYAISSLAYSASIASAITFMGIPGFAYSFGYSGLWYVLYGGIGVVVLSIAAYKFRVISQRLGAFSVVEYLGNRFDSELLRVLSAVAVLFSVTYIAGQLVGMGWALNALWNIPYGWGVVIGAIIVTAYVVSGGSHATALAGALQATIMTVVAVVIFLLGYLFLFPGGVQELNAALVAQDPVLGWDYIFNPNSPLFNNWTSVTLMLAALGLYYFNPNVAKYTLTVQSPKDIKKFLLLAFVIIFVMGLAAWGGLGARAYLGPGQVPDQAMVVLFKEAFHPIIGAVVVAAILAAVWSSCADALVVIGNALGRDLYQKILSRSRAGEGVEKMAMLITRIGTVVFAIVSIWIALSQPPYLTVLTWVGLGATMGGITPVLLTSVLWKGTTKAGAIIGVLAGWAVHFSLLFSGTTTPFRSSGFALIVAFVVCIVVSLLTKPLPVDLVERAFGNRKEAA